MKQQSMRIAGFSAMLALTLLMAPAFSARAQGEQVFFEDFDDGEAQGWNIISGWVIGDGLLGNDGYALAEYPAEWPGLAFGFDLRVFNGSMQVYLRQAPGGGDAYLVRIDGSETSIRLSAGRFVGQSFTAEVFGSATLGRDSTLLFIVEGGVVQVQVNGQTALTYEDPAPLEAPGGFALEMLQGNALIDNAYVNIIAPARTDDVPPEQPAALPDLRLDSVQLRLEGSGREQQLLVDVFAVNMGQAESAPAPLLVAVAGYESISAVSEIPPLPPGASFVAPVTLPLPADFEGDQLRVVAEAFPATDGDPANNRAESNQISAPGGPGLGLSLLVILGTGAMMMLAIGSGVVALLRRADRRSLQRKAKTQKPHDPCQPGKHYVQVEPQFSFMPAHFTDVGFLLEPTGATGQPQEIRAEVPALNASLTLALHGTLSGLAPAETQVQIESAAQQLATEMIRAVRTAGGVRNVSVNGHLEGIEVEETFTLYRCKGGKWVESSQWEASQAIERDEFLLRIGYVDPEGTSLERLLTADLSTALRESFIRMRDGVGSAQAPETIIHRGLGRS